MTEFHLHINSVCHYIQFTVEEEQNLSLPFLDVLVTRYDKTLRTQVYRKPTHTDRYLHFDSHHPQHQKLAVTKTLYMTELTHTTPSQQMHDTKPPMFFLFYNSTVSLSGTPTRPPRSNNGTQHGILNTLPPYLMYRVLQNVSVVFLTKLV